MDFFPCRRRRRGEVQDKATGGDHVGTIYRSARGGGIRIGLSRGAGYGLPLEPVSNRHFGLGVLSGLVANIAGSMIRKKVDRTHLDLFPPPFILMGTHIRMEILMRCPRCLVDLRQDIDEGVVCTVCDTCHGTWISGKALERLLAQHDRDPAAVPPADAAAMTGDAEQSGTQGKLRCAECRTLMIQERFEPSVPVTVHRCPDCDYVWLNAGERELLLALHYQFLTSGDPTIAGKRKRLARLQELQGLPPEGSNQTDAAVLSANSIMLDGPRLLKVLENRRIRPYTASQMVDNSVSAFVDFVLGLGGSV